MSMNTISFAARADKCAIAEWQAEVVACGVVGALEVVPPWTAEQAERLFPLFVRTTNALAELSGVTFCDS